MSRLSSDLDLNFLKIFKNMDFAWVIYSNLFILNPVSENYNSKDLSTNFIDFENQCKLLLFLHTNELQ